MSQAELQPEVKPLLMPETAMATRVIRSEHAPRQLLLWLSAPAKYEQFLPETIDGELSELIDQLLGPLLEYASGRERKQARFAAGFLSMACREIAMAYSSHGLESGHQLLAAGLLPLYRCLATGEFGLCFEQTRHRLLESLIITTLCIETGSDLVEWLNNSLSKLRSPHAALDEQLALNVVWTGTITRDCVFKMHEAERDFAPQVFAELRQLDAEQLHNQAIQIPEWAEPDLLWRLAGEIISDEPNFVLPRSWIEADVPWRSALEHWQRIAHVLAGSSPLLLGASKESSVNESTSNESGNHDTWNLAKSPMNTTSNSPFTKILIAEVLSHNDPAFVSLIGRQLARCRVEVRSISLAAVVVNRETPHPDAAGTAKSVIQPWHQKIVNKLAEHPDIEDSFAFVTKDSELFVCLLDIERSDATRLLRHGLTRILGLDHEELPRSLSAAKAPANFYAGLATAGNANPNLSAEELIESTLRCLTAAVFSKKSSIKSIEVY